uniref:Uncharacterized protein n=1 Tax=Panagrolaimus davidi TaxID=227884 RepID=A0A914QDF8_9BILA
MKKKPNLRIHFHFEKSVYHKKINAYIDKLVAAGIPDSRPPYFDYNIIDSERRSQLEYLHKAYDFKIHGDF